MNVVIIDDDPLAITDLTRRLAKQPDITIEATANRAKKGLNLIRDLNPDVAFLDVEMPDMSGLDLLSEIGDSYCKIVVYTSHEKYMLTSFRKDAFDYLMKPIDSNELQGVVEHCRAHSDDKDTNESDDVKAPEVINDKLIMYTNTSDFKIVHLKDIGLFVYNPERRTWEIVVAGSTVRIPLRRTLNRKAILKLDNRFAQVSQSYIININYLVEVVDNMCHFFPPFDIYNDVHIGRFFRYRLIDKFNKL
jgi:two-component system LytT family response regulator